MPGLIGIISTSFGEEQKTALQEMVRCMEHESFYASGTYVSEKLGAGIGWTCHKGTFADCLPIWNERRDVCLFFTGEHNGEHQSAIAELRAKGHECAVADASYLVHLYEEDGLEAFLCKLNGWFSGVLMDFRDRQVVLFNDRYGLKRVYYYAERDTFYFASEGKALLEVLPKVRRLDTTSLGEFFACGCVLENRSLFSGVSLLPGGSKWMFAQGQAVKMGNYFQPEVWEKQSPLDAGEYYEKLKETFGRVLPRYLDGGGRVAVSLTAGVDSRMIMAQANGDGGSLPCYTFGGSYRDCVDVKVARRVAELCGQPHQVIPVGREFLAEFPALAEKTVYVTDGAMDVSGSADLFVNRVARQIAPVRLTGNYGGEILRSIVAFKPVSQHEAMFEPEFDRRVRAASATYEREAQGRRLSFVAFKQVPWHHYSRLCLEQSQVTVRSPYLDNDLVSLVFQAPPGLTASNELCLRLIADANLELSRIGTDRGLSYGSLPVMSKVKHLYQEFTFKAEYAYDYGMPQWLARLDHAVAPLHLERLFLGRHKFCHFRVWYRDALAGYLRDVLLDSRTRNRPYFQRTHVEQMVRNHISGRENHTSALHRILTSELIQRRLIERN